MQYTSHIVMHPNYATPRSNTAQLAILAAVLLAVVSFSLGYLAADRSVQQVTAQPPHHEAVNGRFGHFIR